MNTIRRHTLVLAIYPTTRGFAFALFEGPFSPYDWGVSHMREGKNEWCLKKISALLDRYSPDAIVLQDMSSAGTWRAQRIRSLNGGIERLAEVRGLPAFAYSRRQVRDHFPPHNTRQQIAETIAKHIPAFESFLPPVRKIWKSENPHMSLFDAAALALTHYQSCAD
jgi:hypothetical protein